jgi:hypothetical protein
VQGAVGRVAFCRWTSFDFAAADRAEWAAIRVMIIVDKAGPKAS